MATIGSFTQQADGSYSGSIKTLTLNVKAAQLRANDKTDDKAPDFRIFSGQTEFGAASMAIGGPEAGRPAGEHREPRSAAEDRERDFLASRGRPSGRGRKSRERLRKPDGLRSDQAIERPRKAWRVAGETAGHRRLNHAANRGARRDRAANAGASAPPPKTCPGFTASASSQLTRGMATGAATPGMNLRCLLL